MLLDSDRVKSKNRGLCRAFLTASVRSSRLRSAVACGSAASNCAYRSAALRPLPGGLPSWVPSGSFALGEQLLIRRALDQLAGLQAKGLRTGTPRPAGWVSRALAGWDVVGCRAP